MCLCLAAFCTCHCTQHRYIIQLAFVWALPSCKPAGAAGGSAIPLDASRLASSSSAQGPTSLYLLGDKETVDLIPQGVEGANIIYDGVTIIAPAVVPAAAAAKAPEQPAPAAAATKVAEPAPAAAAVPAPVTSLPSKAATTTPPPKVATEAGTQQTKQ
jgi:hypothetical protein